MVPLYWIWTSTTTSIIKEFFVSENQYIGKLTILTTFFYYLCNANDIGQYFFFWWGLFYHYRLQQYIILIILKLGSSLRILENLRAHIWIILCKPFQLA